MMGAVEFHRSAKESDMTVVDQLLLTQARNIDG